MWFNKYIGIPYQNKGRDSTGVDCWGLVRLVYSEQYNIDLPSFSTSYENEYRELIQEVIAQYKEGWQQTQEPAQGDIILFKVLGTLSHVGIYLGDNKFMHAREGQGTVVIESTTSREWEKRIVGYFKYTENTNTVLNSAPHPLRTEAFTDQIVPGTTVLELVEKINKKYHIPTEIEANYVIMIDGNPVPESTWITTIITAGQKVEYRALAKGSAGRMLLMIAVVVAASYIAGPGGGAAAVESFAAGGAAVTTASTGYLAATTMALNMAGMVLINAIAPIRMPTDNTTDPGSAKSQNLFSGGSNSVSKYAAIPVVLGKMRITPPLGAQQFVEFQGSEQSRLNSLLVWGYGPLDISDIQIGANDLSTYADYRIATVPGLSDDNTTLLDDIYGSDITQKVLNTQLINISTTYNPDNISETARNPYTEHQITQKCTSISLAIHFPEGLRAIQTKGQSAGTSYSAPFTAEVAYRLLDNSFNPVTGWSTNTSNIPASKQYITTAGYNGRYVGDETGSYYTYTYAYRWTRVYISKDNTLVFINGAFTESQYAEPSVAILTALYGTRYGNLVGINTPTTRLPNIPADAILAYDICFNGNNLIQTINHLPNTTQGYSGLALTFYSPEYQDEWGGWAPGLEKYANITSGSIVRIGNASAASITISIGADNQEFNRKKDAFTYLQEFSGLPLGYYEIRIKRTNTSLIDPDADAKFLHSAYLYSVTGKTNIKPAVNPPGCALAKTALSILSGNNINGTLEGINGLVHSICLDWDSTTKIWDKRRPTSNPASLFLHVIIHPANAFKLALDGDRINLAELGAWHEYCDAQGFAYNNVLDSQKSILDTLKDIAAAGRASPTLIDGKWSVVIDRPRTSVVQHFTPHNSWGFEGVKTLPRQPDAFRVVFRNEDKAYQEEQIVVPNIGYTEETAAIIEEISLPGVTNRTTAFKHARWHLAQLRLRPEVYSLNSDFEYLVCNRGDLVRVSHDVPMWGNSTGRISSQVTSTSIDIDEPAYLEVGKSYNIRIRTAAGLSVLKSLTAITTTQYYSTINLTTSLTALEAAAGNLFMLGELNRESQELIVLSIEPMGNTSARLTLTDYSPEIYNVDTSTEYPIPSYDPNLTQLPEKLIDTITQIPQIDVSNIKSDESVLTITSGGQLISNIRVPFNNLKDQSKLTSHIEVQYDFSTNVSDTLQFNKTTDILAGSITLTDVQDSTVYKIRARYISSIGIKGPWSSIVTHTVIGKTSAPSNVATIVSKVDSASGKVQLSWTAVSDLDLSEYEVRTSDSNWGTAGYEFKGSATTCFVNPADANTAKTFYVKAVDVVGNYSATATSTSITVIKPTTPTITTTAATVFNKISRTNSNAKLNWTAGAFVLNNLNIATYEISLTYTVAATPVTIQTKINAFSWETDVNWSGIASFKLRSVDILNNVSDWSDILTFTPSLPNTVGTINTNISGTDIYLDWEDVETSSLPIIGYEIRNSDSNWGSTGALWKGSVSNATLSLVGKTPGTLTWYIKAYDSVNKYSDVAKSVVYTYTKPTTPTITTTATTVFNKTSRTNSNAKFNWAAGSTLTNGLDVDTYEVNLTYTSPVAGTIQTKIKAFSWETAVIWSNTASFKVRSVDVLGNVSDWSSTLDFITELPNTVGTITPSINGTDIYLDWEDIAITSLPIIGYEVRTTDTNWGSTGSLWKGSVSNVTFSLIGKTAGTHTWYVKAYDSLGNYSNAAKLVNYTITAPIAPVIDTPVFQDTSLTNANVTLTWSSVEPLFGLYGYEVTYDTNTIVTKSNTITIPANWLGDKTISVKTIDNLITSSSRNESIAGIRIVEVRKPNPIPIISYRAQVIDNTVLLYWDLPAVTTLPISAVRIKKGGTSWQTAELIGDKSGTFTSFSELSKDTYTYRIAVVDTDGNESDSVSLTTEVSQPPNYVFNKEFKSTFTSIAGISTVNKTNAYIDNDAVVLPVNLSETWEGHYTANNWSNPQAQIIAGYPLYIQPGLNSGSYQEIFDYVTVLASSQITVNLGIITLAGTADIKYTISTSLDGITYKDVYTNVNSIFSTQFRYIKILVEVTQTTVGAICKLNDLSIRLDSKQKTDSDSVVSTLASSGTIANFNKEFIDITAINVTANSSSPLITVYDFLDKVKTGTYSVVSGICTIIIPTDEYGVAHNLLTGQKVRVFFTSGLAPSGIYTVTSATTNTYTFNITSSNTSGNVNTYPNSMRIYVYNTSGVLQNNVQVSWTVSGY